MTPRVPRPLTAVIFERRALAEAVDAGGEDHAAGRCRRCGTTIMLDDFVLPARRLKRRTPVHAAGGAAHRRGRRLPRSGSPGRCLVPSMIVVVAAGDLDADQRVAFVQADRDDAVRADVARRRSARSSSPTPFFVANIRNCSSLPKSLIASTLAIFSPSWNSSRLAIAAALAGAAHLRHVVHAALVDAALVGEEQQVVVRVGDEQVLDEVAFLAIRCP